MRRGQQGAPFQLLLAAVVLAVLLPVAFNMFYDFQSDQCEQRIFNNLHAVANEIEQTASFAATDVHSPKELFADFSLRGCGTFTVDKVLLYNADEETCMSYCHQPNCYLLRAMTYDYSTEPPSENEINTQCIRVPLDVKISSVGCDARSGLRPVGEELEPRSYNFVIRKQGFDVSLCEKEERK